MKSIDFKSLLIGILGTLLVIACTGASNSVSIKPLSDEIGRYAVSCSGNVDWNRSCVILDTTKGIILGRVGPSSINYNLSLVHPSVLKAD